MTRKARTTYGYYLGIPFMLLTGILGAVALTSGGFIVTVGAVVSAIVFLSSMAVSIALNRCPHCNGFTNMVGPSAFCPQCGGWIPFDEDSQPPATKDDK